jgi:hypothetical protein
MMPNSRITLFTYYNFQGNITINFDGTNVRYWIILNVHYRYMSMNLVRNAAWISCALKKILPGACSSPRPQYVQDYGVLPLLIANGEVILDI